MDEGNLAILVDAKTEYTKQLVNIISPNIFKGIKSIYNNVKLNDSNNDILFQFQIDLSEIPKWNQEVINDHYNILVDTSKCDWLEDLLTAVFVSHTRILTSINFNRNKNKINLKIPKVDHFIHLCYIEVARNFWKNPYLFDDTISKFEYQRNRRDAEKIIDNTINETIRKQLPVKHILKEYLGSEFKEANTDFTVNENNTEHENLRKMVQAEIENCSKEKLEKLNINSLDLESNEPIVESTNDVVKIEEPVESDKHGETVESVKLGETVESDKLGEPVESDKHGETVESDKHGETVESDKLGEPVESDKLGEPVEPVVKFDEPVEPVKNDFKELTKIKPSDNEISELELESVKIGESNNLSEVELDVENTINNEINNLKIETLNLNIDDDDLSTLDEIYIDTPNNKQESLEFNSNENSDDNKIKTVYIETNDKQKKKNTFNETDIEISYDDEDNYKNRKYSKQDFNFFK
jgi:hypothetical protein